MPKRGNGRTSTERRPVTFAVIMGGLLAAHAAPAQEADSVTVDVGQCTKLESPEERFACYEARVETELRERDSAARAGDSRSPGSAESPAQATEPPAQAADASNQSAAARAEEPVEIVGVIASLRETVPNSYIITLEDGQVWRQTYPERYPLRAGQRVTLSPTRWGESYRLEGDGLNGYIQVAKVR